MGSIDIVTAPQKVQVDEEACLYSLQLASSCILPMTLKAAVELNLLEILVAGCGGPSGKPVMTAADVANNLKTDNPLVCIHICMHSVTLNFHFNNGSMEHATTFIYFIQDEKIKLNLITKG